MHSSCQSCTMEQMNYIFPTLMASVLFTSFAGSLHCVGMCGGLVLTVVQNQRDSFLYQLGRLLGYLALGTLAGLVGKEFFSSSALKFIQAFAGLIIFIFFVWLAKQIWQKKNPHLSLIPASWLLKLQRWSLSQKKGALLQPPFLIGASSALLPCGWLHTFVIAAITTAKPSEGALTLLLFWLGTLPALTLSGLISSKLKQSLSSFSSKLIAVAVLLAGTSTLALKTYPLAKETYLRAKNHLGPRANGTDDTEEPCPFHS